MEKTEIALSDEELEGLRVMRMLNSEYLSSNEGSCALRNFLTKAIKDERLLLAYLKGRKGRPKHAWEMLKRYGETRFDVYPELYPEVYPKSIQSAEIGLAGGVLRSRDELGRKIFYFDTSYWDADKVSLQEMTMIGISVMELLLYDEDAMTNGVMFVQDCSNIGRKHVQQYTFHAMQRIIRVFWSSYPFQFKGAYFVNVPYIFSLLFGVMKPFMTKKIKDRICITSSRQKYEAIHNIVSPENLPKCLGGQLEGYEGIDMEFYHKYENYIRNVHDQYAVFL